VGLFYGYCVGLPGKPDGWRYLTEGVLQRNRFKWYRYFRPCCIPIRTECHQAAYSTDRTQQGGRK
jgi:hypothetical protein